MNKIHSKGVLPNIAWQLKSSAGFRYIRDGFGVYDYDSLKSSPAKVRMSESDLKQRNISSVLMLLKAGVCEVWELDLASFDSVKAFANRASKLPRLDIVVENAGIATYTFDICEGHERTITVNVISTFMLGLLLLPKLKATAKAFPTSSPHLSIVTSDVHAWTRFPERTADNTFVALDSKETADMQERYATSKLLEVLVVRELATRLGHSGVILNMLTPGLCKSQLSREAGFVLRLMIFFFGRQTEVGSRTILAAAEAGWDSHGAYMLDGKVNNGVLSTFVQSEARLKAQQKVWKELVEILEEIQPGITNSI
ncbi:hypothetical protein BBP40_008818 [Aspergillus hancockii]|nr:hypothetical protein BBP40_008818 [Aspergillus hancockii]